MRLAALACVSLCGCASPPAAFLELGAGVGIESGNYNDIDETGCVGYVGVGLEFEGAWYVPDECGVYHRSQCRKRPEIATNDLICKKRWGGNRK